MRVGGGVLDLLFPVTSDPWGVVCCACWPGRPGAGFGSWGCGGLPSGVPRRGGVPVGVCVACAPCLSERGQLGVLRVVVGALWLGGFRRSGTLPLVMWMVRALHVM